MPSLARSGYMRAGRIYNRPEIAPKPGAALRSGFWPTPTAVWRPMEGNVRYLRKLHQMGRIDRHTAAKMIGKDVYEAQGKVVAVPEMLPPPFKVSGHSLNPQWWEWLMGYPIDWTRL